MFQDSLVPCVFPHPLVPAVFQDCGSRCFKSPACSQIPWSLGCFRTSDLLDVSGPRSSACSRSPRPLDVSGLLDLLNVSGPLVPCLFPGPLDVSGPRISQMFQDSPIPCVFQDLLLPSRRPRRWGCRGRARCSARRHPLQGKGRGPRVRGRRGTPGQRPPKRAGASPGRVRRGGKGRGGTH